MSYCQNYFSTNEFEIEDLGIQEDWVYDIEIEDNHNFFANDILVHNSFYLCFDSVVEEYLKSNPKSKDEDIVEFIDQFCKKVVSPIIKDEATKISIQMNALQDEILWEREAISNIFISTGKKRYACSLLDDEGTRLVNPKRKIIGLEIKRSDTPAIVKKSLEKVIDLIFANDNEKLVDFIELLKEKYKTIPSDAIAIPSGVSDITKFLDDTDLSLPQHVRAAIVHNRILKEKNLTNYAEIVNGDKLKYVFLKRNPITLAETIAFNDIEFLKETGLDKYIDYTKMFERSFMSPTKTLTDAIGWDTSANEMLMSLF